MNASCDEKKDQLTTTSVDGATYRCNGFSLFVVE